MYQRIQVRCLFDITQTNTTGRFREDQIPYHDFSNSKISDYNTWNQSRNKQRNFETVIQTLGLRAQISDITTPEKTNKGWSFDFTVDTPGAYGDNLEILIHDLVGVPMIPIPLGIKSVTLQPLGSEQNIWLEIIR